MSILSSEHGTAFFPHLIMDSMKTSFIHNKNMMIQQMFNLMLLGVVHGGPSSSGGLRVCPGAFLEVPCLSFQYMQQRLGALQNLQESQEQRALQ